MEKRNSELDADNKRLLNDVAAQAKEITDLKSTVERKRAKIGELKDQLAERTAELEAAEERFVGLAERQEATEAELEAARDEITDLLEAQYDMRLEYEELLQAERDKNELLVQENRDQQLLIDDLQEQIGELEEELEEVKADRAELKAQLEIEQSNTARLQGRLDAAKDFKADAKTLRKLRAELKAAQEAEKQTRQELQRAIVIANDFKLQKNRLATGVLVANRSGNSEEVRNLCLEYEDNGFNKVTNLISKGQRPGSKSRRGGEWVFQLGQLFK